MSKTYTSGDSDVYPALEQSAEELLEPQTQEALEQLFPEHTPRFDRRVTSRPPEYIESLVSYKDDTEPDFGSRTTSGRCDWYSSD